MTYASRLGALLSLKPDAETHSSPFTSIYSKQTWLTPPASHQTANLLLPVLCSCPSHLTWAGQYAETSISKHSRTQWFTTPTPLITLCDYCKNPIYPLALITQNVQTALLSFLLCKLLLHNSAPCMLHKQAFNACMFFCQTVVSCFGCKGWIYKGVVVPYSISLGPQLAHLHKTEWFVVAVKPGNIYFDVFLGV